jgi:polar amino acid transport system substrate-binding protein
LRKQHRPQLYFFFLLPLLWLNLSLPTHAQQLPSFTVATSLNRTPLTMQIEDKLTQAYRNIGYELHIQYLPAERSLKMSSQGKFDGELFRIAAVGQHYPQLLPVPVPLARVELYAFVRAGREHEFGLWQQEPNLRIGFVRGFKMAELYQVAGPKTIVNTPGQAVQMLQQNKIDLLLEDLQSLRDATAGDEHAAHLHKLPELLATEELFHFVHQRHQQLIPKLSEQLRRHNTGKKRINSASAKGGDQK